MSFGCCYWEKSFSLFLYKTEQQGVSFIYLGGKNTVCIQFYINSLHNKLNTLFMLSYHTFWFKILHLNWVLLKYFFLIGYCKHLKKEEYQAY